MSWKVHIPESCVWFVILMFTSSDTHKKKLTHFIRLGNRKMWSCIINYSAQNYFEEVKIECALYFGSSTSSQDISCVQ